MIIGVFDTFPWAAPFVGPAGHQLSTVEARFAFGEHHQDQANYIADGKGFARRVVLNGEARESGLTFVFTGMACPRGHIAPRRLQRRIKDAHGACIQCRRKSKRRRDMRRAISKTEISGLAA